MDAIDLLVEEHQLILRSLAALDAFASEVAHGSDDRAELGRFVKLIREFADARHHGKEEDILFTAMVAAGFSRESGPVAVMLGEHDAGRAHVAAMAERADLPGPWTGQDRAAVVEAARGYTGLLRNHIMKEDSILYPMARQRLPPEALARVDRECERFEQSQVAAGADALKALAVELASRHGGRPPG
jgi:hemerythrin-like domain-containing protein